VPNPPRIDARESEVDRLIGGLLDEIEARTDKREFLELADEVEPRLSDALASRAPTPLAGRLFARRLVNLAVARYHFHHRHATLASGPIQLIVDLVNNCHLSCPGCVHSSSPWMRDAYDWPNGRISEELFEEFLVRYGPRAWGVVFYNWGEPLLDKRTPRFIRAAKGLMLHTCLSTNLSVKLDAAALVGSGLNFVFASIDGVTQDSYSKFRRGGQLDLCLSNLEAIVAERRRQGSALPFLIWRYLTFEHNAHEVEEARAIAARIGVDEFSVFTPFAVPWDDPSVRPVKSDLEGSYLLNPSARFKGPLDDPATAELRADWIEGELAQRWTDLPDGFRADEESRVDSGTCAWLYQSLTMDALGRTMPCCMAPEAGSHKVYGSFAAGRRTDHNQDDFRLSRLAFADREHYERERPRVAGEKEPFCAVCTDKPELTYDLERDLARDIRLLDATGSLSDATIGRLTSWPASR